MGGRGGGEEPAFKRLEKRLPSSAQLFLSPARLRGAWIGKSCDAAVVVVVDVVLNADVVVKLAVAFQEDLGAEKTAAAVGEREREREREREGGREQQLKSVAESELRPSVGAVGEK